MEILSSWTPEIPIPNASTDTNEVEIHTTLNDSRIISNIDTSNYSNQLYECPNQPYSLTSLKQNYIDVRAQSANVEEFLFREICSLKNKVTFCEQ